MDMTIGKSPDESAAIGSLITRHLWFGMGFLFLALSTVCSADDGPKRILDPATPVFGWRELRWGRIMEADFTPGSVLEFGKPGIWERYRWQIIGVGLFGVMQTGLIVGLLVSRSRRLKSEAEAALIADISSKFVNLPPGEVDREISEAQRRLCALLDVDLSALWQWSDRNTGSFTATHLYSLQHGPQPPIELTEEDFPWVRQEVMAGRIVAHRSIDEMPEEAAKDREGARQLGIKSHLTLPLAVGGDKPLGILGFNTTRAERRWPDAQVGRLKSLAQILANALARKRADQSLRESELRLSLAADSAEAGLWELDWATRTFWVNEKARMMFGYSPEEVIDMERFETVVHPGDWDRVWASIEQSARSGDPVDVEYRIRIGDGRARWIVSRGRPFFNSAGEPERLLGLSMDITERKRTEEALRASEARLAAGTELVGLGYYEIDYGERTCFLDDRFREICGVPSSVQDSLEPLRFWMEHVHPDDLQMLLALRQKLHDGKLDRIATEYRYSHADHGQKWIHHLARMAANASVEAGVRTIGVIRDITMSKEAEAEAQELRNNLAHLSRVNTLGALSGSLAHELNQPLGVILSNAQAAQELLAQQPPDVAEVQDILADIVSADRRAGAVIERLRALLKRGDVSLQPLPLNQIFEEVLHLTRADLIGRGITVICKLAADLPAIAGDRVQLQQLVLNLILNAADAMAVNAPGTRRLHLQTMLQDGRVCASVRDEGPGLPGDIARLFQAFYTTKSHGLGLGLAICWSIVAAHHGRLWAEPHAERGAVFAFELPVAGSSEKA